jgi:hypothetical protein
LGCCEGRHDDCVWVGGVRWSDEGLSESEEV